MRELIEARGHDVLLMDAGIRRDPEVAPEVPAREVADAGGTLLEALRARGDRGSAVDVMIAGVRRLARAMHDAGRFQGVLALGGGGGTSIATAAMRDSGWAMCTAALLAQTTLLVANNTGPVHVAAAVGTPVVDLYALTNPQHTPWQVAHLVLNHAVPCAYCYKSICPEGHHSCLSKVSPDEIVGAVQMLAGPHPGAAVIRPSRRRG